MSSDSFEPAQGILRELDIRFSLYYTPQEFAQTFAPLAAGELDTAVLLTDTLSDTALTVGHSRGGGTHERPS